MNTQRLDVLLVHPNHRDDVYQGLTDLAAVQPPIWCGMLATFLRNKGCSVAILDADAEGLSPIEVARHADLRNPRLVAMVCYGNHPSASTQVMPGAEAAVKALKDYTPAMPVLMVGGHVAALPEQTLLECPCDWTCTGEGPYTLLDLIHMLRDPETNGRAEQSAGLPGQYNVEWVRGLCYQEQVLHVHPHGEDTGAQSSLTLEYKRTKPAPLVMDLGKEMPHASWDLMSRDGSLRQYRAHNWHCFGDKPVSPYAIIYTSLGCKFNCLSGDTQVNTIHGKRSIRGLTKYRTFPVYVYDPETKEVRIENASAIKKYGEGERLVRVAFTDGSHIDCTPDHEFLTFKWGNGRGDSKGSVETAMQAQHLTPGTRIRAVRESVNERHQRTYIHWARNKSRFRYHLVAEFMIGRKLRKGEQVHHKDHDSLNDHPDNLEVYASAKEHSEQHPEVAQRMKDNNPAKNMTPEWRAKITAASTGLKRSDESKQRYRESKLGKKNPNYKHGKTCGRSSRLKENNHVVVSVTELEDRQDVYCLTVSTGWFFANDVVVHNCSFCCIQQPFREGERLLGMATNSYRLWSPESVGEQIGNLYHNYGIRNLKIADEMFVLNRKHVSSICDEIQRRIPDASKELNIWAYARVDTCNDVELLEKMRASGFTWLGIGIESASEVVRDGVDKSFTTAKIKECIARVYRVGMDVGANYIFGLPDDTLESMQQTLDLALELNTGWANFYNAQSYPGSPLYEQAIKDGWELPETWSGYSQHGRDQLPLPTKHVTAAECLRFRDNAFTTYFTNPAYLASIEQRYGAGTRAEVERMTQRRLHRNLLESTYGRSTAEQCRDLAPVSNTSAGSDSNSIGNTVA